MRMNLNIVSRSRTAMLAAGLAVAVVAAGCAPLPLGGTDAPKSDDFLRAQGKGPRPRPQTWVRCELFDGLVTPANFDPESDPFDELYTMPGSEGFKGGAPLISESAPGDQDYNGGRWHLNVLSEDADPEDYADACSVDDLDLDDFVATDTYFECPLLPRRGRNP